MISPEEAWQRIASSLHPLSPEECSRAAASGRILATDTVAEVHVPALDVSAMDGYALATVATILEIGCGEGAFTRMLAEQFPSAGIVGVDISSLALDRGRKNLEPYGARVEFRNEDVIPYSHTLKPDTLDLCVLSETMNYLLIQGPFLRTWFLMERLLSALRIGGGLVITTSRQARPAQAAAECIYGLLNGPSEQVFAQRYREFKEEVENSFIEYDIHLFRKVKRNPRRKGLRRLLRYFQ